MRGNLNQIVSFLDEKVQELILTHVLTVSSEPPNLACGGMEGLVARRRCEAKPKQSHGAWREDLLVQRDGFGFASQ